MATTTGGRRPARPARRARGAGPKATAGRKTKRAQVLMDPVEYAALERIAAARGASVGALIREALREKFVLDRERRMEAVRRICSMSIPLPDWDTLKREIEEERCEDLLR
jgi:hypothetical protein